MLCFRFHTSDSFAFVERQTKQKSYTRKARAHESAQKRMNANQKARFFSIGREKLLISCSSYLLLVCREIYLANQ